MARAGAFMADFDRRGGRGARVAASGGRRRWWSPICRRSASPPLTPPASRRSRSATSRGTGSTQAMRAAPTVADQIGRVYARTTLALRLPMWGGFATMPVIRDLPFIARRGTRDPADVHGSLGLPGDQRLVLASFGGYGLDSPRPGRALPLQGYRVIAGAEVRGSLIPLDETAMYDAWLPLRGPGGGRRRGRHQARLRHHRRVPGEPDGVALHLARALRRVRRSRPRHAAIPPLRIHRPRRSASRPVARRISTRCWRSRRHPSAPRGQRRRRSRPIFCSPRSRSRDHQITRSNRVGTAGPLSLHRTSAVVRLR